MSNVAGEEGRKCWVLMDTGGTHMRIKDRLYGVFDSYREAEERRHMLGSPTSAQIFETFLFLNQEQIHES